MRQITSIVVAGEPDCNNPPATKKTLLYVVQARSLYLPSKMPPEDACVNLMIWHDTKFIQTKKTRRVFIVYGRPLRTLLEWPTRAHCQWQK